MRITNPEMIASLDVNILLPGNKPACGAGISSLAARSDRVSAARLRADVPSFRPMMIRRERSRSWIAL